MGTEIREQRDLRGFTATARGVVLDALNRGWTGELSNKGHAILRWPNGGTAAVARNLEGKRRINNAQADIRRIERAFPIMDRETQKPQTTTTTTTAVFDSDETSATSQVPWTITRPWRKKDGKLNHLVEETSHNDETFEYRCAMCKMPFDTPAGAARHATKGHAAHRVNDFLMQVVGGGDGGSDANRSPVEMPDPEFTFDSVSEPELEPEPQVINKDASADEVLRQIQKLVAAPLLERIDELIAENKRLRDNVNTIHELLGDVARSV